MFMKLVLFVWFLIRFAVAASLTAAFAALVVLVWFGFTMPAQPDSADAKTDTIVVLTGGEGRLEQGFDRLKKDLAPRLFVAGVGKVTKEDILKRLGDPPAELAARIELEYRSTDTAENARETAAWFNQQNFKSLRLVTSNLHMRRSLLLFRRALPQATIVADPVVPTRMGTMEWWTHRQGIEIVARELAKYLAVVFHIPLR
ncbi:MAG: YdcF family protein [Rhodospirillaceae bacterium]|nr:YdcF family protein [Rhodospirillaceae bacterium]